jgi:hypothetical protein
LVLDQIIQAHYSSSKKLELPFFGYFQIFSEIISRIYIYHWKSLCFLFGYFFLKGEWEVFGGIWRGMRGKGFTCAKIRRVWSNYQYIYNHPPISTYFILKISKQSGVIYILIPPTYF